MLRGVWSLVSHWRKNTCVRPVYSESKHLYLLYVCTFTLSGLITTTFTYRDTLYSHRGCGGPSQRADLLENTIDDENVVQLAEIQPNLTDMPVLSIQLPPDVAPCERVLVYVILYFTIVIDCTLVHELPVSFAVTAVDNAAIPQLQATVVATDGFCVVLLSYVIATINRITLYTLACCYL